MSPLYADSLHDRVFFQLSRILRKFPHLPDPDYVPHLFFFFFSPISSSSRFSLPSRFRMILVRIHLRINFQISILSFFVRSDGSFKVRICLYISFSFLSPSLSLSFSLSVSHFEPDGNTKIRISKFPSLFYFYPLFFRSLEWKFQGSNLPTNLRHLFLFSPSLSLCPLDSMKIPRFEFIQTFKFPNFHLPRFLFTRSDERWSKLGQRTNPFPLLLSSSLVLFDPSELIFLLLSPPLLGCAPIRRSRLVPGILPPQPGELSQNYGPPVPRKPGPHRDLGEAPSY